MREITLNIPLSKYRFPLPLEYPYSSKIISNVTSIINMLHACRVIIVAPENSDELLKYSDRFRSNPMSPIYSGDIVNPVAIKKKT